MSGNLLVSGRTNIQTHSCLAPKLRVFHYTTLAQTTFCFERESKIITGVLVSWNRLKATVTNQSANRSEHKFPSLPQSPLPRAWHPRTAVLLLVSCSSAISTHSPMLATNRQATKGTYAASPGVTPVITPMFHVASPKSRALGQVASCVARKERRTRGDLQPQDRVECTAAAPKRGGQKGHLLKMKIPKAPTAMLV